MMDFTWADPRWLWALPTAVAIPLLAHLLGKRPGRTIVFPTLRFITQAASTKQQASRPRNLLLLALRAAALALLVAAFARPSLSSSTLLNSSSNHHAIFILDRSYSMSRTHHGSTLFDLAKQNILSALDSLASTNQSASVILLDAAPRTLLPEPTRQIQTLKQLLEPIPPTNHTGNLDAALRLALDLARSTPNQSTRHSQNPTAPPPTTTFIDLYHDAQATQSIPANTIRELQNHSIFLQSHTLGQPEPNSTIHSPTLVPASPCVNQPSQLAAQIVFFSPNLLDTRSLTATLTFAGSTQTQTIQTTANTPSTISFTITPQTPGLAHASLSLSDSSSISDPLVSDNHTGLFFHAAPSKHVALVTLSDSSDPTTAAYYLSLAIAPDAQPSNLRLTTSTPADLSKLLNAARPPDLTLLVEAGKLDPSTLELLQHHVSLGLGLIWVIDSPDAALSLQHCDTAFLPIAPNPNEPWVHTPTSTLSAPNFNHPLLAALQSPAVTALLNTHFTDHLASSPNPSSQTLLTFDSGSPFLSPLLSPLLITRQFHRGQVAVLPASLAPHASNLVKQPVFPPLLHELIRLLLPQNPTPPNPHPSQPITIELPPDFPPTAATQLSALGPTSQSRPITLSSDLKHATLSPDPAAPPGLYLLQHAGQTVAGVHLEIDPAESDLRNADPTTLSSINPPQHLAASHSSSSFLDNNTLELWPWLVLLATSSIAVEQILLIKLNQQRTQSTK